MASCKGIGPDLTVPETNPMAICEGIGPDLTVPETNPMASCEGFHRDGSLSRNEAEFPIRSFRRYDGDIGFRVWTIPGLIP